VTQTSPFCAAEFRASEARAGWFAEHVLQQVRADAPLRVLDIGCGTGGHLFALASRMPLAMFDGVDVSSANIRQAQISRAASRSADRISFFCRDYLEHHAGAYDLVLSDSALHLIDGDTGSLLRKIAGEMAPHALLIATMPDCSLYNRALWGARKFLAVLRGRWLDEIALAVALRIYRGRYEESLLRQRIPYLYLLPRRCEGRALRAAADAAGLEWQKSLPAPHDSVMQPVHVISTYRRAATR